MNPTLHPMPSAPPSLLQRLEWRARHAVTTTMSGEYASAFRGGGMEFDQVVKYQWGDDPRDIDWNVTARLGEPYRKRFVEERDLTLIFVFEDSPALQFGSAGRTRRATLLETAALLMLIGAFNRDRVALLYSSPQTSWFQRPLPGRKGILRIASMLLDQPAPSLEGRATCSLAWPFINKSAPRGSVLLWFGPFAPTATPALWPDLQQRYQAVGVRADDAWDAELPRDAKFSAYDPLAGRLTLLDTDSPEERAAHAKWSERRDDYFAELFPRLDDRMIVHNSDDPLQRLTAWFHRHRSGAGHG